MQALPTHADLARMPRAERAEFFGRMTPEALTTCKHTWWFWARGVTGARLGDDGVEVGAADDAQWWTPGPETWRVWMCGRGWGKTLTAVETCLMWWADPEQTGGYAGLAAPTHNDLQRVMLYGESGVMTRAEGRPGIRVRHHKGDDPCLSVELARSSGQWEHVCRVDLLSAEKPERFRGPSWGRAWVDELGVWPLGRKQENAWAMLPYVLRLPVKHGPKGIATMTPLPTPEVKAIAREAFEPDCPECRARQPRAEFRERACVECGHRFWPRYRIVHGSSYDNPHLSQAMRDNLKRMRGTRLHAQEAEGKILDDVVGALWLPGMIKIATARGEPQRIRGKTETREQAVRRELDLDLVCVAVDPANSESKDSAETGIIVAGRQRETGFLYILEDCSVVMDQVPEGHNAARWWAKVAYRAVLRWKAELYAAERNNGGNLVDSNVRAVILEVEAEMFAAEADEDYESLSPQRQLHWRQFADRPGRLKKRAAYCSLWADRSKAKRAEPVAIEYEAGRVWHLHLPWRDNRAHWSTLEHQQTQFSPLTSGQKRDRMDALVHACRTLLDPEAAKPEPLRQDPVKAKQALERVRDRLRARRR